ncbi:MAG: fibronectin type III domain-containing protein [Clostridiales bacterium]|nr:fibronectin type III domain-containing protein [Clostridiales bacterium]
MKMQKWKKTVALLLAFAMVVTPTVTSMAETNGMKAEEVSNAEMTLEKSMEEDENETVYEATVSSEGKESEGETGGLSDQVDTLEAEKTVYYSYYECIYTDRNILVGASYRFSGEGAIYYYAEYYYDDPEDCYSTEGYCEIDDISISGSADYDFEEDDDGYLIIPWETGELTVTFYYTPSPDVEDTVYNGVYSFTFNAVDELTEYSVNIEWDNSYILPGEATTFDATVEYNTMYTDGERTTGEYEGDVTYQWTIHDENEALASTTVNGSSVTVTAKDSLNVDPSPVWAEVEVFDADGTLLCTDDTEYQKISVCTEYYEFAASPKEYSLNVGESTDVNVELLYHTLDGTSSITSGVTYYLRNTGCSYSWYSEEDPSLEAEDLIQTDGLHIEAIDFPSDVSYFNADYLITAEIDGNEIEASETFIHVIINRPSEYTYYYSQENEEWLTNNEYSIAKDDSIDCEIKSYDEDGDAIYSNIDIPVTAVTAVTENGESLDVQLVDGYYVFTPTAEGNVTVTLFYDSADGDNENSGEYSFILSVCDVIESYYLTASCNKGTLLPGQSAIISAAYMLCTESAEDYSETEYDGNITYEWSLGSSDAENVVTLTPSGNTCTVTAVSTDDVVDENIEISVAVYDEEGNKADEKFISLSICSEYCEITLAEDSFSLAPGESITLDPSVAYYSLEYPEGKSVSSDEITFSLIIDDYYLVDEGRYIIDGSSELDEINAVSMDVDTLTITALKTDYNKIRADILLSANVDDIYSLTVVSVTIEADCEHKSLTYHPAADATCITDGYEEYWTCDDCGKMFSDSEAANMITEVQTIPATGHTVENGVCVICGEEIFVISECEIILQTTDYIYDGEEKKPAVIVKNTNGNTLTMGTDYEVAYYNNINAGTATATITGISSYNGSVDMPFTISKADQTVTAATASSSIFAGDTAQITASGQGSISYKSSDTSIAKVSSSGLVTGVSAGTVTITVMAAGTDNYNGAKTTLTIKVKCKIPELSGISNITKGVKVSWESVTGAEKYRVYRKTSSGSWKKLGDTKSTSYTDTTAKSGTTYYYTVRCINAEGTSNTSSYDSTGLSIKYLKAGKISSLINTSKGITVKWSKVSGAKGYYLYRKTSGGSFKKIATITSGSTVSYSDTSVKSKNGKTYIYAVRPYSGSTKGSYTSKTTVRLTAPSISSLKNSSSKKMAVKWSKNSKATGYQIQYSTSSDFSDSKTVTVKSYKTVSKTISSLKKGKTYYVRVRAYKIVDGTKYYSAWNSKKKVKISK